MSLCTIHVWVCMGCKGVVTSAPDVGEWSASHSSHLTSGERAPGKQSVRGFVCSIVVWTLRRRENHLVLSGIERYLGRFVQSPITAPTTLSRLLRIYHTLVHTQKVSKILLFWYTPLCFSVSQTTEIPRPTQHCNVTYQTATCFSSHEPSSGTSE